MAKAEIVVKLRIDATEATAQIAALSQACTAGTILRKLVTNGWNVLGLDADEVAYLAALTEGENP